MSKSKSNPKTTILGTFDIIKGLKIELTQSLENLPTPLFAKEG
jgi:hypothetical protein